MSSLKIRAYVFYYMYAKPAWEATEPYVTSTVNAAGHIAGSAVRIGFQVAPMILDSIGSGIESVQNYCQKEEESVDEKEENQKKQEFDIELTED